MPITTRGPVPLKYSDRGEGDPALLLMPGWCATHTMWQKVEPRLARRHRVLTLDWRGHGRSAPHRNDFGTDGLVEDARAVADGARVSSIVPVASAHAGWVAIELRRVLGDRVAGIVLVDWIVGPPPTSFLNALGTLQDPDRQGQTVDQMITAWSAGSDDAMLLSFLEDMRGVDGEMWARAGREIDKAYASERSPLDALGRLAPPVPVLHLYAQPGDDAYLEFQQAYARGHPWFAVRRLPAGTHFPQLEMPDAVAALIDGFVDTLGETALRRAA